MKKVLTEGLAIVILFLGIWFALAQVDWITLFQVQRITHKTEEKLGKLFLDVFKQSDPENNDKQITVPIDSIVTHLCKANGIDRSLIKVHILQNGQVNAFALPDGHLVIYTGLINNTKKQEELAGVIGHEMAHITSRHVMKKLVKELGLSILISMTTGNTGAEVIKESAKLLSSTAFDRGLEREADIKAVDYLVNANVDPEPFAEFLYRLSEAEPDSHRYITWISTHPESRERAEYIIEHSSKDNATYTSILSSKTWEIMKENIGTNLY